MNIIIYVQAPEFDGIVMEFKQKMEEAATLSRYVSASGEDPVGSGDFWPAGSDTFFIGSGSYLSQRTDIIVYNVKIYAYSK